jgi:hypothetical protein
VKDVVNYLADRFDHGQGYAYNTLSVHVSAISNTHQWVDGRPLSDQRLIKEFLDGAFHVAPPKPKYDDIWEPNLATKYLRSLKENSDLSLSELRSKLIFLLAFIEQLRSSDIERISLKSIKFTENDVSFIILMPKEATKSNPHKKIQLNKLKETKLCPVECLRQYIERTQNFRTNVSLDALIIEERSPHKPIGAQRIAKLNLKSMSAAGIDVDKYKAHSLRAAGVSAARDAGLSEEQVAQGKWASTTTMRRHYDRSRSASLQADSERRSSRSSSRSGVAEAIVTSSTTTTNSGQITNSTVTSPPTTTKAGRLRGASASVDDTDELIF